MGRLVRCLMVTYEVDGEEVQVTHGSAHVTVARENVHRKRRDIRYSLELGQFEHIEYIECTYSQRGLHELNVRTNGDRTMHARGSLG